jgi:regulator of protease activity HflC (stomatin/prohibitin superfamily)
VVVEVDAIIYYEVTDPVKVTYNVAHYYAAATKLAQTNLPGELNYLKEMSSIFHLKTSPLT